MAIEIAARAASAASFTLAQTRMVATRRAPTPKAAEPIVRSLMSSTAPPEPTEMTSLTPGSKASTDLQILMKTLRVRDGETGPPVTDFEAEIDPPVEGDTITIESSVTTVHVEQSVEVSIRIDQGQGQPQGPGAPDAPRSDPLVLDLNGNGRIDLSTAAAGRMFDINADGRADRTAFVTGGDAFLALDRNGDGLITSGAELFGDQRGAADGFADLAALDDNHDGQIDARDSRFADLRVFDGVRSRSLADAGVTSIQLDASRGRQERGDGNAEIAQATFTRTNGQLGRVADVLLAYQAVGA